LGSAAALRDPAVLESVLFFTAETAHKENLTGFLKFWGLPAFRRSGCSGERFVLSG
jgi:hypothetical protein